MKVKYAAVLGREPLDNDSGYEFVFEDFTKFTEFVRTIIESGYEVEISMTKED